MSEVACIYCGVLGDVSVIDSRWSEKYQAMKRRRECQECNFRWSTVEVDTDQVDFMLKLFNEERRGKGKD
jgi:transcriptional regulator NrdR family protein